MNFDIRKLPLISKLLINGLYHNPSASGKARYTPPVSMLPVETISLPDPIYFNDKVKWVTELTVRKPLYGDFSAVSKAILGAYPNAEITSSKRTAFTIARLAQPVGFEGEQIGDPAAILKAMSSRSANAFNEALGKLNRTELLTDQMPEGATFWREVEVLKPLSSHADVLETGEGVNEERMTRYIADLVKFKDNKAPNGITFSTAPDMIASLGMQDFEALVNAVGDANELAFPAVHEGN